MSSTSGSLWGMSFHDLKHCSTQALTFIFASLLTGTYLHYIGRPRAMILGVLLIVSPLH